MDLLNEFQISPEQEIVLHSIRIDHAQDERIKHLLDGELDWFLLRQFSLQHGVLPLLYTRLKSLEDNLVPDDEMEQLQGLYLANAQRNLRLTRMMLRVFDLLSKEGIQYIPIKGPTLAMRLYGDTAPRHFSDLDVLIQGEDFRRCYEILTAAGFTTKATVNNKDEPWLLRADTEYQFTYQGDILEIHWALAERGVQYPLKEDQVWNHLQPIEIHGREVLSLSLENLLLMLCIHGTKHVWGRLNWIADLAYFTKAYPDMDWFEVLEGAKEVGFHRVVCLGLLLAESLGGAQLPSEISSRVGSDPITEQLANEACATLLDDALPSEKIQVDYYLRARERVRDRTYYILDQAFIPKQVDWTTISLPKLLYPVYYILRPIRLLIKFGPKMVQTVTRN
jgi:hypothetical protein